VRGRGFGDCDFVWGRGDGVGFCSEGIFSLFFFQTSRYSSPLSNPIEYVSNSTKKEGSKQNRQWPTTLMGVLSTVLLSAGVLRHYYDIYVHRTVRGISFLFVGIDALGDVFSFVSVCKLTSPFPISAILFLSYFTSLALYIQLYVVRLTE